MEIYSVNDSKFAPYGRLINGVDTKEIGEVLKTLPLEDEMRYVASETALEALSAAIFFRDHIFAGMPIQMGSVTGRNSRLDCLEHHMCSEIIMDTEDVVLLLAKREDIEVVGDPSTEFGVRIQLDTSKVKAFLAGAGQIVEMYNSTLHFTPCGMNNTHDYRGLVVLSQGTNGPKRVIHPADAEDLTLWARNNWLLAHTNAPQAKEGAYVGLVGENIDLAHAG